MSRTRPLTVSRVSTLVALVTATVAVASCSAGPTAAPTRTTAPASASASPSPSPSPSPTPTATATPTATPTPTWTSPLDGLPGEGPAPVLVVKLDNTTYAQPHAGLTKADVVYVEEVEYGITRLAAVFSRRIPARIGPVRSARITDIDLLAQYDRPAFAFSGAQHKMWPVLAAAPFYDISPNKGGQGYSRDPRRRAPYNYYLDGRVGIDRAPDATPAHDLGLAFDVAVPTGGLVAESARMKWGYSSAGFDYDPQSGSYDVLLNGGPAQAEESKHGQRAATVVIQYVRQRPSAYWDKGGGNTPHAETIGTGRAWVLRDGQAWKTTWTRPTAEDGTTFTLADGSVLPFKPGQLWVVLLDRTRKASVTPLTAPSPGPQ